MIVPMQFDGAMAVYQYNMWVGSTDLSPSNIFMILLELKQSGTHLRVCVNSVVPEECSFLKTVPQKTLGIMANFAVI